MIIITPSGFRKWATVDGRNIIYVLRCKNNKRKVYLGQDQDEFSNSTLVPPS